MTTTGKALETLLEMCEESNASDLHLATGLPPHFRIKGSLLARNDLRTALGIARYPAQLKQNLGIA